MNLKNQLIDPYEILSFSRIIFFNIRSITINAHYIKLSLILHILPLLAIMIIYLN